MQEQSAQAINEVAKELNTTVAAIRHICNQGLIPQVRRDRHRQRVLEPWQVDLARVLLGMKQAGFRPREVKRYAQLFRQGKQTEKDRLAMLTTRKRQLWHEIEARQKAIDFIERQEELAAQNVQAHENL